MSTNVGTATSVVYSVAPMLSVRNGARAVEFYKAAFGAIEVYRVEGGEAIVSQLEVEGSSFWVADESPEHANFSPETVGGSTTRMLLQVADPDAAQARAVAAGAREVYRVEDPGGSVVSRLSVEGAEFWLSDESPEHGNFSPESLGGGSVRMILTVPDPDAMFAKAVAAGAREVIAVEEAYGWRLGRVVDPFGHHWEIGRPLAS